MTWWVGTSGWQYRDWRGVFYPDRLPQREWLRHYVERFDTVEVNNTFYMLPDEEVFASWRQQLPSRFRMVCKLSRYLSHIRRLRDPEEPVRRFLEHAAPLRDRMGPLLLQLPPRMKVDVNRLDHTLSLFRPPLRVAFEVRDASWHVPAVDEVLRAHDAALVLTDRLNRPLEPVRRTASWGYVRLHEGLASPRPCYSRAALRAWADRIATIFGAGDDVYVFFNNDPHCCAIRDAAVFARIATSRGLAVTRAPVPDDLRLGV